MHKFIDLSITFVLYLPVVGCICRDRYLLACGTWMFSSSYSMPCVTVWYTHSLRYRYGKLLSLVCALRRRNFISTNALHVALSAELKDPEPRWYIRTFRILLGNPTRLFDHLSRSRKSIWIPQHRRNPFDTFYKQIWKVQNKRFCCR